MQNNRKQKMMYRTPSGPEIDLAGTIRKYASGPCWARDDGWTSPPEKSCDKSVSDLETIAVQIDTK